MSELMLFPLIPSRFCGDMPKRQSLIDTSDSSDGQKADVEKFAGQRVFLAGFGWNIV
jgi:hypothetical protein